MRDYKKITWYYANGVALSIRNMLFISALLLFAIDVMVTLNTTEDKSKALLLCGIYLLKYVLWMLITAALTVLLFATVMLVCMYCDMGKDPYSIDKYAKDVHVKLYLEHRDRKSNRKKAKKNKEDISNVKS